MQRAMQRFTAFFYEAHLWRALLEAIGLQVCIIGIWLLSFKLTPQPDNNGQLAFYCMYGVCSLTWVIFRWRFRPVLRSRWHQIVYECGAAVLWTTQLCVTCILFISFIGKISEFENMLGTFVQIEIVMVMTFIYASLFLVGRVSLYIVRFWNKIRNTRLRLAVTHSHIMVVIITTALMTCLFVLLQMLSNARELGINLNILAVFLLIFFFLVSTAITILFVLPPSLLSSYLFARKLTQRIERLASAATTLRSGDYSVRVDVDGEDEIARLQTDFNVMAEALERTMKALKEERDNVATLLNARRELIASVSHELRTPVATVRSYLESSLAIWQQEQPPETLKQDMHVMEHQVIRLQSLINDLFTLARAEVGRLEMRPEPTNVELLVTRVAETIAPVAWRGSRVEVVAEIIPELSQKVPLAMVDGSRLEQILQNLLHNGIRHTPPGGIVALLVNADQQHVIIQVRDTGEGIPEADIPKIWDRFFRANNKEAKPGTGSGLGLAIVKELTETMQGSISVESVLGEGTCFTLCFPIAKIDDASTLLQNIQQAKTAPLTN